MWPKGREEGGGGEGRHRCPMIVGQLLALILPREGTLRVKTFRRKKGKREQHRADSCLALVETEIA